MLLILLLLTFEDAKIRSFFGIYQTLGIFFSNLYDVEIINGWFKRYL